ncbi:MAG: hypothetical protein IT243_03825 [Bacteroidia bacterium]|nr:hypothetical protein [Bacteroidia bacterium]
MKTEILSNIDNPQHLEKLYRENKNTFKSEFNSIYHEINDNLIAQVWYERLNFDNEQLTKETGNELIFVIIASAIAGFIAKIPEFTIVKEDFFFSRNIAFIVLPFLSAYFLWKQKLHFKKYIISFSLFLISAIYINLLPENAKSDTLVLACIHLPFFLWAVFGYSFIGNDYKNKQKRLDFLRFNGDLTVIVTIVLIAGGILTGITLGLFNLIDVKIEDFYIKYIVIWGLAASPIVGTYLININPQLVSKVSPVIAKVFTPLVLITLVIYLFTLISTGKDPYNDRDFLIIFNLLLIGVMAIILFSIAETSKVSKSNFSLFLLLALSIVTILVNGIALSAILFRITEWGITPNRLAVLGGNILILSNLVMVMLRLIKSIKHKDEIENAENSIASFLPLYSLWSIIVTFVFPLIFNFK